MAAYIVLDTETADKYKRKTNKPEPWNSLVYDLGYCVVDSKTFEVLAERSYVVSETFNDSAIMQSSYYADKLPQYRAGIRYDGTGEWAMADFKEIWHQFKLDCKTHSVRKVWAYNCEFDRKALDSTIRTYSNGFAGYFVPYSIEWGDIWDYCSNITATRAYLDYCTTHGLFTATGNPSTTAESVYGFLTDTPDYIERHTALEDAKIETAILTAARKRHKKTRHNSRGQGWRDAAALNKKRNE